MPTTSPVVAVIMGSQSDWAIMRHSGETLDKLEIPWEARVTSAHRTPDRLNDYVGAAKSQGFKVIIAGAGMAAALPGAAAAISPLPVLGVPMEGKLMGGLDAVLAMVQMPAGIPVGTLAVGRAGAVNAALMAAAIRALSDPHLADRLDAFRAAQTAAVPEDPALGS